MVCYENKKSNWKYKRNHNAFNREKVCETNGFYAKPNSKPCYWRSKSSLVAAPILKTNGIWVRCYFALNSSSRGFKIKKLEVS